MSHYKIHISAHISALFPLYQAYINNYPLAFVIIMFASFISAMTDSLKHEDPDFHTNDSFITIEMLDAIGSILLFFVTLYLISLKYNLLSQNAEGDRSDEIFGFIGTLTPVENLKYINMAYMFCKLIKDRFRISETIYKIINSFEIISMYASLNILLSV